MQTHNIPPGRLYDRKLLLQKLAHLQAMRESGNIREMMFTLRSDLIRNVANIAKRCAARPDRFRSVWLGRSRARARRAAAGAVRPFRGWVLRTPAARADPRAGRAALRPPSQPSARAHVHSAGRDPRVDTGGQNAGGRIGGGRMHVRLHGGHAVACAGHNTWTHARMHKRTHRPPTPRSAQLATLADWPEAGISTDEKLVFFR